MLDEMLDWFAPAFTIKLASKTTSKVSSGEG